MPLPSSLLTIYLEEIDKLKIIFTLFETNFFIPRINKGWLSRFPFYSFPTAWNELDPTLKSLSVKGEFKYKLKHSLLSKLENF